MNFKTYFCFQDIAVWSKLKKAICYVCLNIININYPPANSTISGNCLCNVANFPNFPNLAFCTIWQHRWWLECYSAWEQPYKLNLSSSILQNYHKYFILYTGANVCFSSGLLLQKRKNSWIMQLREPKKIFYFKMDYFAYFESELR